LRQVSPGLALNLDLPHLCFLSSSDFRLEPLAPSCVYFFTADFSDFKNIHLPGTRK
jgi:hypothetical protein